MTKDDINEILLQNREYLVSLIKNYLVIYINILLFIDDSINLRNNLNIFYNEYLNYNKLEKELLKYIKRKCRYDCENTCNEIIEELNKIFFIYFQYNEWVLSCYEDMLLTKDKYKASIPNKSFKMLNDELKNVYVKN